MEAADRVLIATTPDDFDDPTHFNVQPPIYWIEKFAEFGFMPDITHDAGYLTPYAILFTKQGPKLPVEVLKLYGEKKLQDYEFAGLKHQSNMLQRHQIENRAKIEQQAASIAEKEKIILDSANHVNNLEDTIAIERAARENLQFLFDKRTRSFSWKIIKPIRLLERAVKFFTPIFPVVFSTSHGEKLEFSPIDVGDLGWAKVEAFGATSSQFQLSFHGLSVDTTLSFPAANYPPRKKEPCG